MYTTIIDNTSALQEHSAKVVQNRVSHGTRATTTSVLVRNSAREHGDGFTVSHTQSIESPDVRKLAELAQLGITDEEEREWSEQIESIVAWFGQLQEVDVEGVEPAMRGGVVGEGRDEEGSRLRRDVGRVYEARDDMLNSVPRGKNDQVLVNDGGFLLVPKIATSEASSE